MKWFAAALAYFGIVFAVGFALGVLRELIVVRWVGPRAAELVEMPVMLLAIIAAARYVQHRFLAQCNPRQHLQAGFLGLGIMLLCELGLGMALRGLTIPQILLERDPLTGTIYYLMLLVFALLPWMWRLRK